jgi:hypothetical protein
VAKPELSAFTPSVGWKKVKVRREGRFIVGGVAQMSGSYLGLILGVRAGRLVLFIPQNPVRHLGPARRET